MASVRYIGGDAPQKATSASEPTDDDPLRLHIAHMTIEQSQKVIWSATAIEEFPQLITKIVDDGFWKRRMTDTFRMIQFESFTKFVGALPPDGLSTTVDVLRKLCRDSPEAIDAIDRALAADAVGHRPTIGDAPMTGTQRSRSSRKSALLATEPCNESLNNVKPFVASDGKVRIGNSAEYGLRRLRAGAPELHARVLAGELTTHAAMREAGFRPQTATVRIDDPSSVYRALRRGMSPAHRRELGTALLADDSDRSDA